MLAIIPARGGSKGLPEKNVRLLGGVPLICHSIHTAMESNQISRIIVSTDDVEIATIAKACGAEVPFMRPLELASDNSMVIDAYLYTIDRIETDTNQRLESFIALPPTAPLRLSKDIDGAIELYENKTADSVISITEAEAPIQWCKKINNQGILCDYFPQKDSIKNRQDFDKTYVPNGAIYVFRTEILRASRQYYTDKTYPYLMPRERSADIDELLDFEWAEFLLQKYQHT